MTLTLRPFESVPLPQVPLPPYPQPGQMYMSQMGGTLNGMPMGVAPISGPNSFNSQRSTGGTLGVAPLQQPAAGGQIGGPSTASGDVLTGMLASGAMQSAYGAVLPLFPSTNPCTCRQTRQHGGLSNSSHTPGTFQRGQAFFQGGLDKLSSSTMYHLFSVTPEYGLAAA